MSLLTAVILPMIEKEIAGLGPIATAIILRQLKAIAGEIIEWAEKQINVDINGDGIIGDKKDKDHGQ